MIAKTQDEEMKYRTILAWRGIIGFLLFLVCFVLFSLKYKHAIIAYSELVTHAVKAQSNKAHHHVAGDIANSPLTTTLILPQEDTQNEELQFNGNNLAHRALGVSSAYKKFEMTIKSCLGSHCMNEQFDSKENGQKIIRIGVLMPHKNDYSGMLDAILSLEGKLNKDHTLTFSTHVPPYGYGRNHGWSKIIRVVDNLFDDSYRLLVPFNSSEHFEDYYDLQVHYSTVLCHISLSIIYLYIGETVDTMALSFKSCSCPYYHVDSIC